MPRPRRASTLLDTVSNTDDVIKAPDAPFPAEYLIQPGENWRETSLGRVIVGMDAISRGFPAPRLSGGERESVLALCDFLLSQSGATFESVSDGVG